MALDFATQYPGKSVAPNAAYPYGSAQNITVAGDGTGSPWEKQVLNDLLGMQQELLDKYGVAPTGSADQVGASQYVDAIRAISGHPGLLVPMVLNAAPSTFNLRVLLLDGSVITAASYVDLVTATYVGDGNNASVHAAGGFFVKTSDAGGANPNVAGPYFTLPDMRGQFLRGRDTAAAIDPDGASRDLGHVQTDAVQYHNHTIMGTSGIGLLGFEPGSGIASGAGVSGVISSASLPFAELHASATDMGLDLTSDATPVGRVDTETRGTNCIADWGIWY